MARAKQQGGDQVSVHDADLAAVAGRRETVRQQLDDALANDRIRVHYQPVFDIDADRVVGAEALLRIADDAVLLSPAEYVEAAESSGLISRLGLQVLRVTCEQLAAWSVDASPSGPPVAAPPELSVNVSPRQLADPDLPGQIEDVLGATGVEPRRLVLEITESILIGAQPVVDTNIGYLHSLGVRLGLDDFGTGQSSLGYLKRFPLDFVKIDQSLVAGLGVHEQDTAIVRATIELAHQLGLIVVAVGVETDEQLEALAILGCDRAQGYLFAPPQPADELLAWLASGPGTA
jgi:EAL domain-containing protein (putative c-di-GMP-specific phosphodiesterase class I)